MFQFFITCVDSCTHHRSQDTEHLVPSYFHPISILDIFTKFMVFLYSTWYPWIWSLSSLTSWEKTSGFRKWGGSVDMEERGKGSHLAAQVTEKILGSLAVQNIDFLTSPFRPITHFRLQGYPSTKHFSGTWRNKSAYGFLVSLSGRKLQPFSAKSLTLLHSLYNFEKYVDISCQLMNFLPLCLSKSFKPELWFFPPEPAFY